LKENACPEPGRSFSKMRLRIPKGGTIYPKEGTRAFAQLHIGAVLFSADVKATASDVTQVTWRK
jgi:hypothetical protein